MARPESHSVRLSSLDSLRGLAALSVVLTHILWLYRPNTLRLNPPSHPVTIHGLISWLTTLPGAFLIESTPLHLAFAGHEAVILFYLLSGFVLYLSCEHNNLHDYGPFLVKRCCRLYLPYLAALGLAVALNATVSTGHLREMNDWFNHTWQVPINRLEVVRHALMVGSFNTDLFLMPCWTLVHEMRISLVFPLLAALVVARTGWLPAVVALLSASGIVLDAAFLRYGNYFITLHYAALFLLGASLAQRRVQCARVYASLSPRFRAIVLLIALVLYGYGRVVALLPSVPVSVADLPVAAGGALIIVWALTDPRLLALPPVRWLGRVCYGLYLLHFSLFLASIYLLHALLPLWAVLAIAFVLSIVIAELFCRVIEIPAIQLGRHVAGLMKASRHESEIDSPVALTRFLPRLADEERVPAAMPHGARR